MLDFVRLTERGYDSKGTDIDSRFAAFYMDVVSIILVNMSATN